MKYVFRLLLYSLVITACLSNRVTITVPVITASVSVLRPLTTTSTPLAIFLEEEDKSAYWVWNIGNSSSSDYPEFWEEYELAIRQGETWVYDPLQVALHLLHPSTKTAEEPSCFKEEVAYVPTNEANKAVFIFIQSACSNDSVRKVKIRVELSQQDKLWKIDWFGGMTKCRHGRGELEWDTKICS